MQTYQNSIWSEVFRANNKTKQFAEVLAGTRIATETVYIFFKKSKTNKCKAPKYNNHVTCKWRRSLTINTDDSLQAFITVTNVHKQGTLCKRLELNEH